MEWLHVILCCLFIGTCQGFFNASNGGRTYQIVEPNSQALITIVADDSATISWQHLELDSLIARYKNKTLVVLADQTLYSLSSDVKNGSVTLQMSITVDAKTMGNYRCSYSNGSEAKTAYFYVGVNTTTASVSVAVTKFTECCKTANVSASCLPACDAGELDFQAFKFSACASANDVAGLRKCLTGRRNHVRCCSRRRVQGDCLALCSSTEKIVVKANCTDDLGSITQCFYEGKEAIPSPPASLVAQTPERQSIQLHWSLPRVNLDLLTGFLISYKSESDTLWNKIIVKKTIRTKKITGVKMNVKYSVFVQAISMHGTSYPSETVVVSMLEEFFYSKNGDVSVSDCCSSKKVDAKCQTLLCAGIPRKLKISDILSCIKHWHSILGCYAGGRNHTACCVNNGLASSCLKFCSGKQVDTRASDFVCLAKASVMTRCFDAGVRKVPSAPSQLAANAVSFQSITWRWKKPSSVGDAKSEMKYRLSYRNLSDVGSSPHLVEIIGNVTSFKLTGLKPGATYQAELSAFNEHGSSLESNRVQVATHSGSPVVLPPQGTHDPAACCHSKLVPTECKYACDLKKPFSRALPASCKNSAPIIASCLADGRDHSHCCFHTFNIATKCQFLCKIQDPSSIPSLSVLWSCMQPSSFEAARKCFATGLLLLPSAPRTLQLLKMQPQFAKVHWEPPSRLPDLVTEYELSIAADKKESKTVINNTSHLEASVPMKPNTNFVLRVVAVTRQGQRSLPSNAVSFRTLPKLPANYFNQTLSNFGLQNVTTCCANHDMNDECREMCSPHSNASYLWTATKMQHCTSAIKIVIQCSADRRDHTGCCKQRQVPVFCHDLCLGHVNDSRLIGSLVCARFLPEIRSCFLDGYETLPAAPLLQEIRELSDSAVRVKFAEPDSNDRFTKLDNYLYYKNNATEKQLWQVKANMKSPFILDGLKSLSTYSFFMVAENDNGTSLPSALLSATTFTNAPFTLYILAIPSLKVKEGKTNLRLSCMVSPNGASATFSWFREGQRLSFKGSELRYSSVSRHHAGQYTCLATLFRRTVTRSVFLIVQSKISVTASTSLVRTPLYRSIEVACTFSGFPDTMSWIGANGKRIMPSSTRYLVINSKDNHYTVSKLKITQVLQDSYGEYKCEGENQFGKRSQSIFIEDPSHSGVIPSNSTLPTVANPPECCVSHSVSSACQDACSFNASRTFFSSKPTCLPELALIVPCLADGRNHSRCCVAANVPSACLPLCAGLTPNLNDAALLACFSVQRSDAMLRCMQKGSEDIPSEPRSLKVESQLEKALVFSWKPPEKNPLNVISYEVKVIDTQNAQKTENADAEIHKVQGQMLRWTMKNPPASHTFVVWVRAVGVNGTSHYSSPVTTFSFGPPMAPANLHAEIIGNVSVKLSWQTPHHSKVPSKKFKVIWHLKVTKKKGEKQEKEEEERTNITASREIIFPCLKEKSQFMFQVVAVNSYGTSAKSEPVLVNTKENFNPHCAKKKIVVNRTKKELGAYVAVVVLVLFLVAGLMSVLVFIKANRHNPNYAWPGWLRRLPGLQFRGQPLSTYDFDNPVHFDSAEQSVRLAADYHTSYA